MPGFPAESQTSTLLLSDADICAAFDWKGAIAALESAYALPGADAMFPPRSMARGPGVWLRALSGILPRQEVMGAKLIAASPSTAVASYLMPIFELGTMALVALIDANSITGFRTAATSALASRRLCGQAKPDVAVIGSGFEARKHLEALARSGPLGEVRVFSPRATSRAAFCVEMADKGIAASPATSAEEAVAEASLVVCAARSRDESPTILGSWLRPGTTVVSVGSTLPEQRELDVQAIARADLIVADMPDEVAHDTGDMVEATRAGVSLTKKLVALADVVSGSHPGRTAADQIVIYKSVGAAIQDLAVAAMCLERARDLGLGTSIPSPVTPVNKGK